MTAKEQAETTVNKDSGKGTPQGAPISPLLANLYMRRFLLGWKQAGWDRKLQARIVNYAVDFVILCRGTAEPARAAMEAMMRKLKLSVNQQKTRICRVPEESFDFLATRWAGVIGRKQERLISAPSPRRTGGTTL